MNIGDIRRETPYVCSEAGIDLEFRGPQRCVVVYIHPMRRFWVGEFTSARGENFWQSFYFPERQGNPDAPPLKHRKKHEPKKNKTLRKAALYSSFPK